MVEDREEDFLHTLRRQISEISLQSIEKLGLRK